MSRGDHKKKGEHWTIEEARRLSSLFPAGELKRHESPDWLIPDARLGIEVRYVTALKAEGDKFSGPELSMFQHRVVTTAEHYYKAMSGPPCDVLVYFRNDFKRKRDPDEMGKALAAFVRRYYPADKRYITMESFEVDDWPDGFAVIRICTLDGGWNAGGTASATSLNRDYLAENAS